MVQSNLIQQNLSNDYSVLGATVGPRDLPLHLRLCTFHWPLQFFQPSVCVSTAGPLHMPFLMPGILVVIFMVGQEWVYSCENIKRRDYPCIIIY